MLYFAAEKLGEKTSLTPEGYLLCLDVPIARTGVQLYQPEEVPQVEPADDGYVHLNRPASEVFKPEAIASFNGKPIVVHHPMGRSPDGFVHPDNWQDLAVGVILNPRKGKSEDEDVVLADLQITVDYGIDAVNSGMRQVSCGYKYELANIQHGTADIVDISGNHLAFTYSARCGDICSIQDSHPKGADMNATLKKIFDSLRGTVEVKDKAKFEAALDEATKLIKDEEPVATSGAGAVHVHVGEGGGSAETYGKDEIDAKLKEHDDRLKAHDEQIKKCMDSLFPSANGNNGENTEESDMKDEAEPGKEEEMKKATDSKPLADSFQRTVAAAEVLVPGIALPAFDSGAPKLTTFKNICAFRRQVLTKALKDEDTKGIIQDSRGGRTLDSAQVLTMPCGQLATLFFATAGAKKRMNNDSTTRNAVGIDNKRNGGSFGSEQDQLRRINVANWERHHPGEKYPW